VRASKKLKNDEGLLTGFAGTRLRMELSRVPLWRGDHVEIKQLAEDFARYVYLPRLQGPDVLIGAIRDGLGLLLWRQDSFGYADSFDEAAGRYRGLRGGELVTLTDDNLAGLVVKAEVAVRQQEAETPRVSVVDPPIPPTSPVGHGSDFGTPVISPQPAPSSTPRRYHGTVALNSMRVSSDAGKIAEEVIAHIAGLVGAEVRVTLEIEADIPGGVPDNVVRTVTENGRTLKFTSQGFETE
jgi:hypothetical protein